MPEVDCMTQEGLHSHVQCTKRVSGWRERNQTSALGRVLAYIETHRDGNNFNLVQALAIEEG